MQKDLQEMFSKSSFSISLEPYFYCQVKSYPTNPSDHFMISDDGQEITVVTQNTNGLEIKEKNPENWLLVSLKLETPFMKGTLFEVSKVIYESDSNVLIVSTYSNDLLFIKEQDKEKVEEAMSSLGFKYQS